jgi:hypothetical protein
MIRYIFLNIASSAGKAFARIVNDMAFSFKDAAPGILAKHFTIRNPGYVSQAFRVEKAKPGKNPVATVGPITGEKNTKTLPAGQKRSANRQSSKGRSGLSASMPVAGT